jgi:hypothetical protein
MHADAGAITESSVYASLNDWAIVAPVPYVTTFIALPPGC